MSLAAMSNIRLKYSGLMGFLSKIVSVFTGLLFTILVTRRLSQESFGTWQFYSSLLSYFALPASITCYWITRDMARGEPVAKSGVFLANAASLFSTMLFIILSPVFVESVEIDIPTMLVFGLWIIAIYQMSSLQSICHATMPQMVGYGTIVFETSKVVIGALLVGYLRLSLFGAVISIDLALFIQMLFYLAFYLTRVPESLKGKVSLGRLDRWFRMGWIPLVSLTPGLIVSQDVLVVTLITGSLLPAAYLKAASVFAVVIGFSETLAIGLYPKLLSGGTSKDVEESIELILLFLIPMVLGQLILAELLLYVLGKNYAQIYNVLRVMSLCSALNVTGKVFSTIILGVEKADVNEKPTWRSLAKSYLIRVPIVESAGSIMYIIMVSIIAKVLNDLKSSMVMISLATVSCLLLVNLFFTLYFLKTARKIVSFNLDLRRILKFLASGLTMSTVLILLYPESAKSVQILTVLTSLIPMLLIGVFIYFITLYLIDNKFRRLLKNIWKR
jgi:O-antigen/teichoic acid export membrane protein